MAEFKVGDRVELVDKREGCPVVLNSKGHVKKVESWGQIFVDFDHHIPPGNGVGWSFTGNNIYCLRKINKEEKPMKDVSEATQTVGGHSVRIYATDGKGDYPVHGAVWNYSFCYWQIETWTEGGYILSSRPHGGPFNLDLSDWKEEIPWEHLEDWINWVARNCSGQWSGFHDEPVFVSSISSWVGCGAEPLIGVKMPEGPKDAAQAIAKRPEGR